MCMTRWLRKGLLVSRLVGGRGCLKSFSSEIIFCKDPIPTLPQQWGRAQKSLRAASAPHCWGEGFRAARVGCGVVCSQIIFCILLLLRQLHDFITLHTNMPHIRHIRRLFALLLSRLSDNHQNPLICPDSHSESVLLHV